MDEEPELPSPLAGNIVWQQTDARYARREAGKTERGYTYGAHTEGQLLIEALLPDLAKFMLSGDAPTPHKEGNLLYVVRQPELTREELAFIALSSMGHEIVRHCKEEDQEFRRTKINIRMGRVLRNELKARHLLRKDEDDPQSYRRLDWSEEQYLRAGAWLLNCVLKRFPEYFVRNPVDGVPEPTKAGEKLALDLCAEYRRRNPEHLPTTEPLHDWTGWRTGAYWHEGARISEPFVRDYDPATEAAVKRAIRNGTMRQHLAGVNSLQRVLLKINAAMLPVVERFAGEVGTQAADIRVKDDLATANDCLGKSFRVPMNCDFRGRVYGIPDFNFQREDYVRALFQFADPMPIGEEGLRWLKIHVANRGDLEGISKRPLEERVAWAESNRELIERIADDTIGTVDKWRDADAPFSFVAGCKELAAAWKEGPSFMTHLPVCCDASCNGVQHLSMLMRDEEVGRLVNLMPGNVPLDFYGTVTKGVTERLEVEAGNEDMAWQLAVECKILPQYGWNAKWWLQTKTIGRKLIKRTAMTFGYSATPKGMAKQIAKVYRELCKLNEPTDPRSMYLGGRILDVAKQVFPRGDAAMKFIRKCARRRVKSGEPLAWKSPTGFPVSNLYRDPITKVISIGSGRERARHTIADGFKPGIRERKSVNAASPNFVHSLDAAHLIRVVNAAIEAGITNIVTVHDSFGCLAPQTTKLREIILKEFANLYADRDYLAELRDAAGSSEPLPEKGSLDPSQVLHSEYAFA